MGTCGVLGGGGVIWPVIFEAITTVNVSNVVFWIVTPCHLERDDRCLFSFEDRGDTFARNIGNLYYSRCQPKIPHLTRWYTYNGKSEVFIVLTDAFDAVINMKIFWI